MSDLLQFDIVVVGAGPAGLAAAAVAGESGRRVALVDDTPWLGGQIWRGQQTHPNLPEAQRWMERFRRSGATLLDNCAVLGPLADRVLLAEQGTATRRIQWNKLILATGARELFLPFPGWTLPGNFGPGGLQSLAKHGWPIAGKRVVLAGSGPLLWAVGAGLRKMGATIVSINEQTTLPRLLSFGASLWRSPAKILQAARLRRDLLGIPLRCGVWPVAASGGDFVHSVTLTDGRRQWTEGCDYLACGFGLVPNVELPLALNCQLRNGFVSVNDNQQTDAEDIYAAGELTAISGADAALIEGQIAGLAASGKYDATRPLALRRNRWRIFSRALAAAYALRPEVKHLAASDTIVCRCEDVTFDKVNRFATVRDAKLQTRCGMGSCQGRICGAAGRVLFDWSMDSIRPPILPGRVETLRATGIRSDS